MSDPASHPNTGPGRPTPPRAKHLWPWLLGGLMGVFAIPFWFGIQTFLAHLTSPGGEGREAVSAQTAASEPRTAGTCVASFRADFQPGVFVNDRDIGPELYCRSREGVSFDRDLGTLAAGQIVYVCVGPDETDLDDAFDLDFDLTR